MNFILDFGAQIYDGAAVPVQIQEQERTDIDALRNLFLVGKRANWQIAISPHTYFEISRTQNETRRATLDLWFQELWQYWRSTIHENDDLPTFMEAEDHRVNTLGSGYLDVLPDVGDRVLICDALVYRCDLFCTQDRSTIIKHRLELTGLPIEIVTPSEWWGRIQPFAGLWA